MMAQEEQKQQARFPYNVGQARPSTFQTIDLQGTEWGVEPDTPKQKKRKFFVVAELGVNWDGSKARMHAMMAAAKDAGADAVKFQAFLPEHVAEHPRAEELVMSSLTPENAELAEAASKSLGIEWFCTPFYPEAVDWLEGFGVKRYKIREKDGREFPDNPDHPLLQKVLKTGKEVFISTENKPISPQYLRYHPQVKWLYCFPDTANFVLTSQGAKPIGSVVLGDFVLTDKGRWRQVTRVFRRPYSGKLIRIKSRGVPSIVCTPEHPLSASASNWTNHKTYLHSISKLAWIAASKLRTHNFYETPGNFLFSPSFSSMMPQREVEGRVDRFLGLYLAEGSLTDKGICMTFGSDEEALVQFVRDVGKEAFGVEAGILYRDSVIRVTLSSVRLRDAFATRFYYGGHHAEHKSVPADLLPIRPAMLTGLLEGDGSKNRRQNEYTSVSPSLAWQVFVSLQGMSLSPNLDCRPGTGVIMGRTVNAKTVYRVRWTSDSQKDYSISMENGRLRPIVLVQQEEYTGEVYNLEVEEDNSYTVNGVAVHNCCPKYPPRLEEIEFWKVPAHDGYSNHYPGMVAPLTAGILGAKTIEVHVTLGHGLKDPDDAVSLDFIELKLLVKELRLVEKEQLELPRG